VTLFITGLAFKDKVLVEEAKVGVLAASLIAGLAGYSFLLLVSRLASARAALDAEPSYSTTKKQRSYEA